MSGHGACSDACGWCGACTRAYPVPEPPRYDVCDHCHGDAFTPVTTAQGIYCSHTCKEAAAFAHTLKRRGPLTLADTRTGT